MGGGHLFTVNTGICPPNVYPPVYKPPWQNIDFAHCIAPLEQSLYISQKVPQRCKNGYKSGVNIHFRSFKVTFKTFFHHLWPFFLHILITKTLEIFKNLLIVYPPLYIPQCISPPKMLSIFV